MKYLFLLLTLISMNSLSYSQSVGIGTTTPNNNAILDLNSTTKGLLVPRVTTTQRTAIGAVAGMIVYDTDFKEFYHHDGTSWRKLLNSTIWTPSPTRNWLYNTTDSVGIGTTGPDEKLHVMSGKIYVQDNRANQSPHVIFDAPAVDYKEGGLQWKRSGDTMASLNYVANPNTPNYLRMAVSNNGRGVDLVVNDAGRVGLGVVEPAVKLHIRNAGADEIVRLDAENPMIQFRRYVSILSTPVDIGFLQVSDNNMRIGTNSSNNTGQFVVRTNGTDRMHIDASGVVSVNTQISAPGYIVRIGGKVICEEVKVKLQGNWPDYVFNDQYKLKSLSELEKFIQLNKHLPNIPSAAELEKEGMEVGDMQKKMMEKIEELTLYILQLNKEIETLKKQVSQPNNQ